jgi:hypothetical protein
MPATGAVDGATGAASLAGDRAVLSTGPFDPPVSNAGGSIVSIAGIAYSSGAVCGRSTACHCCGGGARSAFSAANVAPRKTSTAIIAAFMVPQHSSEL